MSVPDGDLLLLSVEAHLLTCLGQDSGRASVSLVGAPRIDVLRFGPRPDGTTAHVTVGMSRAPMGDPAVLVAAADGPRAELVLTLHHSPPEIHRVLAILASTPAVEGLVLAPQALVEVGEPLWPGAGVTAVLVGEPLWPGAGGTDVPDLDTGGQPVRFLPLTPLTGIELALARGKGVDAVRRRWQERGTDVLDPFRI